MATIPSIIFQRIASGAVVTGVLPDISGAPPNLETDVVRQLRGRIWRYKELDLGGLFESPVALVGRLERQRVRLAGGLRKGEEKHLGVDRVGVQLKRVSFSGASTTALTGALVDPYAVMTHIAGEVVVPVPAFNGVRKDVIDTLANGNVVFDTLKITASNGVVFIDRGDGRFAVYLNPQDREGLAGNGTIDYATGAVRLRFTTAPATGTTLSADYSFGSASREYQFLDTAGTQPSGGASLTPAAFTTNMQSDLLVPPGWQIKFVTVGSLTTPGILGIWVSQGMGYTVGQELSGFGSAI